jgi:hypothetical protein
MYPPINISNNKVSDISPALPVTQVGNNSQTLRPTTSRVEVSLPNPSESPRNPPAQVATLEPVPKTRMGAATTTPPAFEWEAPDPNRLWECRTSKGAFAFSPKERKTLQSAHDNVQEKQQALQLAKNTQPNDSIAIEQASRALYMAYKEQNNLEFKAQQKINDLSVTEPPHPLANIMQCEETWDAAEETRFAHREAQLSALIQEKRDTSHLSIILNDAKSNKKFMQYVKLVSAYETHYTWNELSPLCRKLTFSRGLHESENSAKMFVDCCAAVLKSIFQLSSNKKAMDKIAAQFNAIGGCETLQAADLMQFCAQLESESPENQEGHDVTAIKQKIIDTVSSLEKRASDLSAEQHQMKTLMGNVTDLLKKIMEHDAFSSPEAMKKIMALSEDLTKSTQITRKSLLLTAKNFRTCLVEHMGKADAIKMLSSCNMKHI